MGHVISITNQKGGVGKTLTATSLASILTSRGYTVLSIDLDPQCNFDQVAGGPGEIKQYDTKSLSILNVLNQECTIDDAIVETDIGKLVRSTPNLSQWTGRPFFSRTEYDKYRNQIGMSSDEIIKIMDDRFQSGWGATEHKTLDWELREVRDKYDFVILDTNPSLTLLTLNSLYTADYILIPVFPEEPSRKAVLELYDTINDLIASNPGEVTAQIAGILITKYKHRTKVSRAYAAQYKKLARSMGTILFETKIREGISVIEYTNKKRDLIRYAPNSTVAQDYQAFVNEFLTRISVMEGHHG